MLKQRITVGVIGAAFAILVLCLGVKTLAVAMGLIALIGLSEIYSATGILKKHNKLCIAGYIYTITLYCVLVFLKNAPQALGIGVAVYAAFLMIYMIFNHDKIGFGDIAEIFFATMYVSALFAYVILIRKLNVGNFAIWIIFITAWLSDTAAFAVGRRFGANKLIPEVSPKKTVEGAIGGLAGSLVFNIIFGLICSDVFGCTVNYLALSILAIVAGVMSQLGDLTASCIKREHGIKDFSNLLPGHGGVLDRFDSVLFVAPVVYYFVIIFKVIA